MKNNLINSRPNKPQEIGKSLLMLAVMSLYLILA